MRAAALWAIFAVCAAAQGPVTITQTRIAGPDGRHLATGKITITATVAFAAADGARVETTDLVVRVVNGAFSVALEPNDSGLPRGSRYTATWQLDGARARQDVWLVPTTSHTLGVSDVLLSTILMPAGWTVQWAQLAQDGAAVGQAPVWNGSSWQPGPVSGGGMTSYASGLISGAGTTYTIPASVHGFNSAALYVAVWDNSSPRQEILCGHSVDPVTYAVGLQFGVTPDPFYVVMFGPASNAVTLSWSGMTNSQWTALTNSQWTAVAN
jgi:hypothetical protein